MIERAPRNECFTGEKTEIKSAIIPIKLQTGWSFVCSDVSKNSSSTWRKANSRLIKAEPDAWIVKQ